MVLMYGDMRASAASISTRSRRTPPRSNGSSVSSIGSAATSDNQDNQEHPKATNNINTPTEARDKNNATTTNNNNENDNKKDSGNIFHALGRIVKDIFNPDPVERLPDVPRPPKHLLWGCPTAADHRAYVDEFCEVAQKLHQQGGEQGLRVLGFEYRLVHHPTNCQCADRPDDGTNNNDDDLTDSDDDDEDNRANTKDDYGFYESDDDDDNNKNNNQDFQQESYMMPIASSDEEPSRPSGGTTSNATTPIQQKPLFQHSMTEEMESTIDRLSHMEIQEQNPRTATTATSYSGSMPVSRSVSTVSLFSLATHGTSISGVSNYGSGSQQKPPIPPRTSLTVAASRQKSIPEEELVCAWRLHHAPSNTRITSENHESFVAPGEMYDHIARLCMEHSQQVMIEQGDLQWVTIASDDENESEPVQALVSRKYYQHYTQRKEQQTPQRRHHKVLLIVTGKGLVRAGIFSRRHLIVTSLESATALPLIREAVQRDMEIVMLDPNARGFQKGMDVVETSLDTLFHEEDDDEIYVLAHSMAGAQLVRYLHGAAKKEARESSAVVGEPAFLKKIKAVSFTDSNHNINWAKDNQPLTNLLVGPSCLYIKSHKVHEKAKVLGEAHHDCQFWRHRFGDIRTLWAGTHEHALTNYTARSHIWDHFDSFLHRRSSQAAAAEAEQASEKQTATS